MKLRIAWGIKMLVLEYTAWSVMPTDAEGWREYFTPDGTMI